MMWSELYESDEEAEECTVYGMECVSQVVGLDGVGKCKESETRRILCMRVGLSAKPRISARNLSQCTNAVGAGHSARNPSSDNRETIEGHKIR
jgi:hypothetical protein